MSAAPSWSPEDSPATIPTRRAFAVVMFAA
jgi:hypothetical protein